MGKNYSKLFRTFGIVVFMFTSILNAQVTNPVGDASMQAFNDTFLITNDKGETAYRREINDDLFDSGWTIALNIQGMLDTYERTGSAENKVIVDKLLSTFLVLNHPPFDWDGWNDDLAWVGLLYARGNLMNGDPQLLAAGEATFREAYDRGWNNEFTDGGIWEQQPNYSSESSSKIKEALSNNPMGHLACILYIRTGNQYYLEKAKQIYDWSVSHIFDTKNGHVFGGIYRNGNLNTALTAYNQGAFVDFSAQLYEITKDEHVLRNAILASDYTISQLTTNEGILSTDSPNHNTWGAEFVRGLGHLVKSNPELWNKYYPFFKKNSEVAWSNRRMDLDLTWNGWAIPTELAMSGKMANIYISSVALHQHTPITQSILNTIEAENYNFWKDITKENIVAGGQSIKLDTNSDWVEYVVEVPSDGNYTISVDVAAAAAASFELELNHNALSTVNVPATGDYQTYTTIRASAKLKSGFHTIRFKALNGEFNINKWSAKKCDLIQPFVSVNGQAATAVDAVSSIAGDDLLLAPQAAGTGTWSWIGPGNFSASTREVSINDFSAIKGGTYTVQYKSTEGCIATQDFTLSLTGCIAPQIATTVSIYDQGWKEANEVIDAGSFVKITGTPGDGKWSWEGPNGFTANTAEITFNNIGYKEAGLYTVTYQDNSGCKSTKEITLTLRGDDPCGTPIIPYINIGGWREGTFGLVSAGGSFQVGPQASDGNWSWTGPGGFTSGQREFTVSNFSEVNAGKYIATFTNKNGCTSTKEFIVGLEGCSSASIIPQVFVNDQSWASPNAITVTSGGSFSITPPDIGGLWNWSGDNNGGQAWEGLLGFKSNERTVSFTNVLDINAGSLTLTHVDANSCVTTYKIDISVEGDDHCGSEIIPYINANNTGWTSSSTATLEKGQGFTVGPQLANGQRAQWEWTGPNGFTASGREFTITNIQPNQAGVYRLTAANNIGCVSSIEYNITVRDSSLGIHDFTKNSEVSFYPNPALDRIKLTNISANSTISIIDINGKKLLAKSTNTGEEVELNVSSLRSGVYFIVVNNQSAKTKTLKLIKQ